MILLALGMTGYGEAVPAGVLHGLKVAAVAVVAQAVWGMGRTLCADAPRATIMTAAACGVLLAPAAWAQVAVIALAAGTGLLLFRPQPGRAHDPLPITVSRRAGVLWLTLFLALLIGLPLLSALVPNRALAMVDAFYRAGSLVFGGGHVVLPLLQAEVVPLGWVGPETFLAGYGTAQALPGPLFTFAAFLGAAMDQAPSGWLGGALCLAAIFAPSFLLVLGALPFWEPLRRNPRAQAALSGINAAVVGLLLAALYRPVWTSAVLAPSDFALALVALVALMAWSLPPWLVVLGTGAAGWLMSIALQ